jgi:CubicO group peptidase (beta-lactamase class C family)
MSGGKRGKVEARSRGSSVSTAFANLKRFVNNSLRMNGTPGLSLAVSDRDRTLRTMSFGFSDLATKKPVTSDTLFKIASITKSFTSIALLKLREEGKIDLDLPAKEYLPWLEVKSNHAPITIHHLMTHTAAIMEGAFASPYMKTEVWALRNLQTSTKPGKYFHYSDVGYSILGLVLEEVEGARYGEIIQRRIFRPLGMRSSRAWVGIEPPKRMAVGYGPTPDDRPLKRAGPLVAVPWFEMEDSAGSIVSSSKDMSTYLRMLLNKGKGPRGRVLSEESFCYMTKAHAKTDFSTAWGGRHYGYGLSVGKVGGHKWIGHGGGVPSFGYISGILADLDDGLAAVALANGPAETWEMTPAAITSVQAARAGKSLPLLKAPNPRMIDNAVEYTGKYISGRDNFQIIAWSGGLLLRRAKETVPLERREGDAFQIDHPDFRHFLLRFNKQEEKVVEAFSGGRIYARTPYSSHQASKHPEEWKSFVGHYRSSKLLITNFRVFLRKDGLHMAEYLGESEPPLVPMPDGSFRVGEDSKSPERIRFDWIVDGKALKAEMNGAGYYRSFAE